MKQPVTPVKITSLTKALLHKRSDRSRTRGINLRAACSYAMKAPNAIPSSQNYQTFRQFVSVGFLFYKSDSECFVIQMSSKYYRMQLETCYQSYKYYVNILVWSYISTIENRKANQRIIFFYIR